MTKYTGKIDGRYKRLKRLYNGGPEKNFDHMEIARGQEFPDHDKRDYLDRWICN